MINLLLALAVSVGLGVSDGQVGTKTKDGTPAKASTCWSGEAIKNTTFGLNKVPKTPDSLAGRTVTNTVLVFKGCVDTSGAVVRVLTERSSGDSEIDGFYRKAIRGWKGRPMERNGKPVPSVLTVVVTISLGS